jgi:hypothetical protein
MHLSSQFLEWAKVKNITKARTMERQRGNNSSEILLRLAKRWQKNMLLLNGDLISKLWKKL